MLLRTVLRPCRADHRDVPAPIETPLSACLAGARAGSQGWLFSSPSQLHARN